MQRIGLSATQRPLDEVARFLGGAAAAGADGARQAKVKRPPRPADAPEPDDAIHDEFAAAQRGARVPAGHDRRRRARRSGSS